MSAKQNRLAHEASPYLRQHAKNPVDWFPWGPEALEKAQREDKPILLSVGYAACHWCHVMERESFEDPEIAAQMNALFVNIKVDREERPDLDHVYQLVVQLMGRGGGWPLTVFLTPDQRPFFGGTYFPPSEKHGMTGFPKVLDAVAQAYRDRRSDVELQAQEMAQAIGRVFSATPKGPGQVGPELLQKASKKLLSRFDAEHGGFGRRPKFPNAMALDVLLRRGVLEGDAACATAARRALDGMREGGIWDHLRGGFHRYATDERWLVPHFEKMLYDNALLLGLYTDGYRAFGDDAYAEVARGIVSYLLAEMRDASGAFYASQDADSEGHEGRFFVWTKAEVAGLLADDPEARDVALRVYGVTDEGNFEDTGASVLSRTKSIADVAIALALAPSDVEKALTRASHTLLAARERRPRPLRDDKLLVAWNALLISTLCDAARALDEPTWLEAAREAFSALETSLVREGRVGRYRMSDGVPEAGQRGFLDDHAYLGEAALDLYAATHDPHYVDVATALARTIETRFADTVEPGFFFTADDGEALITRTKDAYDQAVPAGAAKAARLLLRLGELDGEPRPSATAYLHATAQSASEDAFAFGQTTLALHRLVRGSVDVVIVGNTNDLRTKALVDEVYRAYLPDKNVVVVDDARPETRRVAKALAEGKAPDAAGPVAYVCRGRACSLPVSEPSKLAMLLSPEGAVAPRS